MATTTTQIEQAEKLVEQAEQLGRINQAIDNLSEWLNRCNKDDRELIDILSVKLSKLQIKIKYINNHN